MVHFYRDGLTERFATGSCEHAFLDAAMLRLVSVNTVQPELRSWARKVRPASVWNQFGPLYTMVPAYASG